MTKLERMLEEKQYNVGCNTLTRFKGPDPFGYFYKTEYCGWVCGVYEGEISKIDDLKKLRDWLNDVLQEEGK